MNLRRFYNAVSTKSTPLMAMQSYICDDITQKHIGTCKHTNEYVLKIAEIRPE